jgi:PST family polysaccharide transporter
MSGKISDVCASAAGAVYTRAMLQALYAVLVVLGALVGQRWGIGGVAVTVSIAMGINWLTMAALSRKVTGLPWSTFIRAQVPGAVLALLLGGSVLLVAKAARAADLGNLLVLLVTALTAMLVTFAVSRLRPEIFLGSHGAWASRQAEKFLRQGLRRLGLHRSATAEGLAKANQK